MMGLWRGWGEGVWYVKDGIFVLYLNATCFGTLDNPLNDFLSNLQANPPSFPTLLILFLIRQRHHPKNLKILHNNI